MTLRSGTRIRFSEIRDFIPTTPGIYEIYTDSGEALKVGISANLCKRLCRHAASLDRGLIFDAECNIDDAIPADVTSKRSILTKHLYFDRSLTDKYDLKTQQGRRGFLLSCCYIQFEETPTRESARAKERELEQSGKYRYKGLVIVR